MIKGHGDDMYQYSEPIKYNFSSNVFGKIDLSGLKSHLKGCMDLIGSYPEPEPFTLEKKLGESLSIPSASISVTSGATEAIYLIAQLYRKSHSVVLIPTFSEYEDACRVHSHHISYIHSLEELSDNTQLVWLCNPNNPTGSITDVVSLIDAFYSHPDILFIIDQSYESFTNETLLSAQQALTFPNVILLHSMTKKFAIPGLRLGYVTACTDLIQKILRYRMPWSVNSLAIEAGLYFLSHSDEAYLDRDWYLNESQWLRSQLMLLSPQVEILPTKTHFMLGCLSEGNVKEMKDYLAKRHGILIRDASNFAGLDEHYFRIAAQTRGENEILINAIKEWLHLVSH